MAGPTPPVLCGRPPADAPWARLKLRRSDDEEDSYYAEIKTDWAQSEVVRQQRRGFFDAMVTAVKAAGHAFWDPPSKRWLVKGADASQELLRNFEQLGFAFPAAELERFLACKGAASQLGPPPSAPPPGAAPMQRAPAPAQEAFSQAAQQFAPHAAQPVLQPAASQGALAQQPQQPAMAPTAPPLAGPPWVSPYVQLPASQRPGPVAGGGASAQPVEPSGPGLARPPAEAPLSEEAVAASSVAPAAPPEVIAIPDSPEPDAGAAEMDQAPPADAPIADLDPPAPAAIDADDPPAIDADNPPPRLLLQPGARVRIRGVSSRPELNGSLGWVHRASRHSGRWVVAIDGDTTGTQYNFRPERLEILEPPVSARAAEPGGQSAASAGPASVAASGEAAAAGEASPVPQRRRRSRRIPWREEGEEVDGAAAQGAASAQPAKRPASPPAPRGREGPTLSECTICMDATVDTVFVPCGHMAACGSCAKLLAKKPCPVCRKKIKFVQRVYMS